MHVEEASGSECKNDTDTEGSGGCDRSKAVSRVLRHWYGETFDFSAY